MGDERGGAANEGVAAHGSDHFAIAWRLTAASWLGCALLQFLLYLRPSPYGGPFLINWKVFIIRPLVYELLSVWLFALLFLLLWLILHGKPLSDRRWRLAHWFLVALMTLNLLFTAFDHELYRFLGIRLGPSFLDVYLHPETMGDSLFLNILRGDRGGPFVAPLICFGVPLLYLWWSIRLVRRRLALRPPLRFGRWVAIAIIALPLATGTIGYSLAKARFRLTRLEPMPFAMIRDYAQSYEDDRAPGDVAAFAHQWRAQWQAGTNDRNWRFPDPTLPYYRVPADPASPRPEDRWNVVIIQMESVRGVDTGHLRPELKPSATPYLDSLARGPDAAVYTRALSFGPPSVNGRFATQCSITPSSRRFITSYTHVAFYCLPDALRRQGYRAEMFSAGDIDMDNSTRWVQLMYDRLWRYPEEGQVDRAVFRKALPRLRELGRQGPFIATLITASNHHPFRSIEPRLDVAPQDTARQRILNTSSYTDDVVRETIEALRGEPWFDRTLFVINSDHGYNLGERHGLVGGYTLYREAVWTPFLIIGPHPRLPKGRHDALVTMLDIAPTIADLIGLREPNPWEGHSLLTARPDRRVMFGFKDSLLVETGEWTVLRDPQDGRARVYRTASDWLQREDLSGRHAAMARTLLEAAEQRQRMTDYVLRRGMIWRDPRR